MVNSPAKKSVRRLQRKTADPVIEERVFVGFRLSKRIVGALRIAAAQRVVDGKALQLRQEIVESSLEDWLRRNGHPIEPKR